MRTLEAIAISKTIIDNVNADVDEFIEEMAKNGFVNVDDTICQYQPNGYTFVNATDDLLKEHINKSIKNKWSTISVNQIINALKQGLPFLTAVEVTNFNAYIEQYQVEINKELIETKFNEILNRNKQYQELKVTINGGRDISNQLIVMKQNNIFADSKTRYLYKFKDGEFQIFNNNDIMGLLNSYLESEENIVKASDVQRNRKIYLESLEDIRYIRKEYTRKRNRANILNDYEDDYKKILKLLKNY